MTDPASVSIVFADLAGFTALTEAHGDRDAAAVVRRFCTLARDACVSGARVVKSIGDAVMIHSTEGRAAVTTAIELLHAVDSEPRFPGVRIGLSEGPVVEQDGDYFGATVNVAARLAEHAATGQAFALASLGKHAAAHPGVRTQALGDLQLKNVPRPIPVVVIDHVRHQPTMQAIDPVCRMLVEPDDAPARLPWRDRTWFFCSLECASSFIENPESHTRSAPS